MTGAEFTPVNAAIPGARPLVKPSHELYALARATCLPRVEAYRNAGLGGEDYHADRGNAAKLERKQPILDRIKFLTGQTEQMAREKFARIENFYWQIFSTKYSDFWITNNSGHMHLRPFSELTEDQQRVIQSLKYTEKGGPILEIYSAVQASIELRKMLALGSAGKDDGDEFNQLDDASLFAQITREAKELGIDVEFTFRANGSQAA